MRCRACRALLLVVPRGVLPVLRYSFGAVILALALWSAGLGLEEVRRRVSPYATFEAGWARVRQWVKGLTRPSSWLSHLAGDKERVRSVREIASRITQGMAGWSPPSSTESTLVRQAFDAACDRSWQRLQTAMVTAHGEPW